MKNKIINILGYKRYRFLLVKLMRFFNNKHIKFWTLDKIQKDIIEVKNKNVYFGYYDHSAYSNQKVLFINTSRYSKTADVCYRDLKTNTNYKITTTNAWNLQMGSRLRWLDDNTILFNDYINNEGYISRKINLDTKNEERYPFPIYDIDGSYSYYTNFNVLGVFRPGYGYDNEKIDISVEKHNNGIYKGNFETKKSEKILDIQDIIVYPSDNYSLKSTDHYINHISCCPYHNTIMFFHLYKDESHIDKCRVFIINNNGKILNVLDDFDKASHYCWKNEKEILLTVLNNKNFEYRLYNYEDGSYTKFDFLNVDGHPTYISDKEFITDTYPDHNGLQHLYLCDEHRIITKISEVYHNPKMVDEFRCDLHPRYFDGVLTFDSLSGKYRKQYILYIKDFNTISQRPYGSELKIDKQLYMFLNTRIDVIFIKLWYAKLFNFKFKAHYLLHKMLHCNHKFLKDLYFNKLQEKYGMDIAENFQTNNFIHFIHSNGVTIGSGVKIGKNCKIYQQVTLGRNKNLFPVIGDNVIIYSGAKILGGINIGNNVIIGANAVVIKDVPDNCVAVGVPARIIKKRNTNE